MSFRSIIDSLNPVKRREDKKSKIRREQARLSGINIVSQPELDDNKKIYFILSNAIINYFVVTGMIGCFVKPFNIQCNMYMIVLFNFVLSIYMAFLYYNMWIKSIGYLIGICGFVYGIINYQWMIRGGFAYIANHIMEYLEKDMDLPIERRYSTYGYNEKTAVTMCLLFLSFGLLLLFNMVISETKGFVLVLLMSFPITQTGMYFDEGLDIFYFSMYLVGITVLYFLRNSTHYHMEYRRRKGYCRKEIRGKKKIIFDYVNDGKCTFWILIVIAVIITALVFSISKFVNQEEFTMDEKYSEWKDGTRDFTRQLALVGFQGMFNGNGQSPGGVSNNKLGQVSKITFDFQTDLVIKSLPVNGEQEIFIKCFNGSVYNNSYWDTLSQYPGEVPDLADYELTVEDTWRLPKLLLDYYGIANYYKQIQVTNISANENYNYLPYFTKDITGVISNVTTDDEFIGKLKNGWVFTAWYHPLIGYNTIEKLQKDVVAAKEKELIKCREQKENGSDIEKKNAKAELRILEQEEDYSDYVKETYLQIPEYNLDAIQNFIEKYDIDENSETLIEDVVKVFQLQFEYTLMPGKTPSEKDFVNYFLEETQKGYCTYFATAATLIYRYLGIPARYAGGYKLSGDAFSDGVDDLKDNPEEWIEYYSGNTKVVKYNLTDNNAHAWVEIYVEGLGWVPVEVTPYSDYDYAEEEERQNEGLGNYLANTVFTAKNMNRVKNTTLSLIVMIIVGVILFVVIYLLIGLYVRQKRYNEKKVEKRYENLRKAMIIAKVSSGLSERDGKKPFSKNRNEAEDNSYEENAMLLVRHQFTDTETAWKIMQIIEKGKFSRDKITHEEMDYLIRNTNEINKRLYDSLSWNKKIVFKYIKML